MTGEPSPPTSTSETLSEQASKMLHGHVNSIKSKLGIENENSPLGKLAAHTKRKLAEVEAARAAGVKAAPGSPDWQAAMKPEAFGKGFVKANRTQFLITAGVFSLGLFWLLVIRFVHHDANTNQTGTSEAAQSAMANRQMAGMAPLQQPSMPGLQAGMPTGFGSPNGGFGAPTAAGSFQQGQPVAQPLQQAQPMQQFQSMQQPQALQFVPAAPQAMQFTPGAQQAIQLPGQQVYSPYAQQAQGYGVHAQSSNFAVQPPSNLYPARPHSAARHQVVVNR